MATPPPILFTLPSATTNLQLPSQDIRQDANQLLVQPDPSVRTGAQMDVTLNEYIDAVAEFAQNTEQSLASFIQYFNFTIPSIGVGQKATFWIGLGANQPPATAVTAWPVAITFEQTGQIWNTAVWKYCLIQALLPPTTVDFIMDLKLDGVSIFDGTMLVLPAGTAVWTIVKVNNFATPTSPFGDTTSEIIADVIQSGPEVVGVQAVLVFDAKKV